MIEELFRDVPSHVPRELVCDVDFYNIPGVSGDVQLAWKDALPDAPLVYTPRNGGHWILTKGADVETFLRDHELTTNLHIMIPPPQGGIKVLPEQSDPPDHGFYRGSIAGFFTAPQIAAREEEIRAVTIELIEGFRARGECDFIAEFANELPIIMFLRLMQLPIEDRAPLRDSTVRAVRGADAQTKTEGYGELQAYIAQRIEERIAEPRDDIISHILAMKAGDRVMAYEEALGLGAALLLGGLDTLASLLGLVGRYLAENPEQRRYIRENPDKLSRIVHELTRRFAPVSVTRVVRMDREYHGVTLKTGDLVLLPTMLHSMDEERFACPHAVDFERKMTPNVTFGSGIHTCVGNVLARTEIRIFLEEWLARIPDFRVKPGTDVVIESGPVSAFRELWLEWDAA